MKGRRLEMGPRHAAESISKPEKFGAAYSTVRAALQIKGREKGGFVYFPQKWLSEKKKKQSGKIVLMFYEINL